MTLNLQELMRQIPVDIWSEDGKYLELFQYQGFRPLEMANRIMGLGGKNAKDDIAMMILISIERGSAIEKMKKKTKAEGVTEIQRLVTTYGLKASVSSDPGAITLPRVSLCFPWAACQYVFKHKAREFTVSASSLPSSYPPAMRCSAFASLIPNTETVGDLLLEAFCLHQYYFSKVINPSVTDPNKIKEKVTLYSLAGLKNDYINTDVRIRYCTAWGLVSTSSTGDLIVADSVTEAAELFRKL